MSPARRRDAVGYPLRRQAISERRACLWVPKRPIRVVISTSGIIPLMALSFFYWAFRRVLELFALRCRRDHEKDLELIVLRHEVQVLRR